jgi:hypothetical protein
MAKKSVIVDPLEQGAGEGPNVPETTYFQSETPDDVQYFDGWQPHNPGQSQLPFRGGANTSPLQFRYFRHDEVRMLNGGPQCGHWQIVKKDLAIFNIKVSDLFVDKSDPAYPFDAFGYIPYGGFVKTGGDRECRESYLAVRPAKADEVEQEIRARDSAKAVRSAHQESGKGAADHADKLAKRHYGLAQNSPAQVASSLTSFDQEMRANMVTSQQWDKLRQR